MCEVENARKNEIRCICSLSSGSSLQLASTLVIEIATEGLRVSEHSSQVGMNDNFWHTRFKSDEAGTYSTVHRMTFDLVDYGSQAIGAHITARAPLWLSTSLSN